MSLEASMKRHLLAVFLAVATCLAMPYVASADLIFDSSLGGVAGSGLGTVLTILTIQSPGSGSVESGSTGRASGADVTSDVGVLASGGTTNVGNVKTGASQTLTRTFSETGITKASQIAIVFNANEPSGNSVTLTGLQLSIFNGNADIFDAHLATSTNFATTFTGTGKEGFVLRLDPAQGAALQGILDGLTPTALAQLRIALSASASDATGGPETFNVGAIMGQVTPVPEPGTLLLAFTALSGPTALAWRRRARNRITSTSLASAVPP